MSGEDTSLPATLRAVLSGTTPATRVIADLAPQLLQRNVLLNSSQQRQQRLLSGSKPPLRRGVLSSIGRVPSQLLQPESNSTAGALDLAVVEAVDRLLALPLDPESQQKSLAQAESSSSASQAEGASAPEAVPLYAGFMATAPAASSARRNRRRRRAYLSESHLGITHGSELGLRNRVDQARGLLSADAQQHDEAESSHTDSVEADGDFEIIRHAHAHATPVKKKAGPTSTPKVRKSYQPHPSSSSAHNTPSSSERQSKAELMQDMAEIKQDQAHIKTRRRLLNQEASDLDSKMALLQAAREELRQSLIKLREEELELQDELEGVHEQFDAAEAAHAHVVGSPASAAAAAAARGSPARSNVPTTSRRRRGPAFLPSEHDSLPVGVAFMTLAGHHSAIASLDLSEPYGLLVSSSIGVQDSSMRVWDLSSGLETATLQKTGSEQAAKCLQVEDTLCVAGNADGHLKVWDLEKIEEQQQQQQREEDVFGSTPGNEGDQEEDSGPCVLDLEAHTKAVTALYFDGPCLVTGSSDKTLRQWDLESGHAVLTMDILWAMNDPGSSQILTASSADDLDRPLASDPLNLRTKSRRPALGSLRKLSSQPYRLSESATNDIAQPWTSDNGDYNVATPSYADGSWDLYSDFVGSLQFWGYALASGSADGGVRMWDMRTGQAHRTLMGHSAPVTSLQFDEYHLISGSLDKSIRVWDLRTGSIAETLRFDGPVTALQFDSRKIVAATGENGVRVYNRTSMQQESLTLNGHTSPVERIRFMDRYLATGGKDNTVKLWSVQ